MSLKNGTRSFEKNKANEQLSCFDNAGDQSRDLRYNTRPQPLNKITTCI